MTDLDRAELRRLEQRYQDGYGDISVLVRGMRAEVDRVKRLVKTERDACCSVVAHAEAAEATLGRVRALIEEWEHVGALGGPFPDRVIVDVDCEVIEPLRAALAPVTEEGDKDA